MEARDKALAKLGSSRLFLFLWVWLLWFVKEAHDKALAKLGSRPDYFSFCGYGFFGFSLHIKYWFRMVSFSLRIQYCFRTVAFGERAG